MQAWQNLVWILLRPRRFVQPAGRVKLAGSWTGRRGYPARPPPGQKNSEWSELGPELSDAKLRGRQRHLIFVAHPGLRSQLGQERRSLVGSGQVSPLGRLSCSAGLARSCGHLPHRPDPHRSRHIGRQEDVDPDIQGLELVPQGEDQTLHPRLLAL